MTPESQPPGQSEFCLSRPEGISGLGSTSALQRKPIDPAEYLLRTIVYYTYKHASTLHYRAEKPKSDWHRRPNKVNSSMQTHDYRTWIG